MDLTNWLSLFIYFVIQEYSGYKYRCFVKDHKVPQKVQIIPRTKKNNNKKIIYVKL